MKSDWEALLADRSWIVRNPLTVKIGPTTVPEPVSKSLTARFPNLARLFSSARRTLVSFDGDQFVLLGWTDGKGEPCGWLCKPEPAGSANLHEDHLAILAEMPGIVERFNDSDSWLLNHNDVLTVSLATKRADIPWDEPLPYPAPFEDWYVIAEEANSNITFCHRQTGEILLFAHDHAFEHVIPLEGYPHYTFYHIRRGATLQEWIETIARQWLNRMP